MPENPTDHYSQSHSLPTQKSLQNFFRFPSFFAQLSKPTLGEKQNPDLKSFLKKFPKDDLPEKAKSAYNKMLNFTEEKNIPFAELNTLLDNLSKKTGVSLEDMSPYLILMQWTVYALLWDLKYNIKVFDAGGAAELPDFLQGKVQGYPDIVLDHLLEGNIYPHPGLSGLEYADFFYNTIVNQWRPPSKEYVLDPTNFKEVETIYHEMYHAFQDATYMVNITEFEVERDAYFVASIAAIKGFSITSEEELLKQYTEEYKKASLFRFNLPGKNIEFELPLPPQINSSLAAYAHLQQPERYSAFQADAERWLRGMLFLQGMRSEATRIAKLFQEASHLYPAWESAEAWEKSQVDFATDQLAQVKHRIARLIRDQAGLDAATPGTFSQWNQILADRLKTLESKAKQSEGYWNLGIEDQKILKTGRKYFALISWLFESMLILVKNTQVQEETVRTFVQELFSSPLSLYPPKFYQQADSDGVGLPRIKNKILRGSKTKLKLLAYIQAQQGLTDEEWATIDQLAHFIDKLKIPLNKIEKISKTLPANLKDTKTRFKTRWQFRLIVQWQAYCLLFAAFKRWNFFEKKLLRKIPSVSAERFSDFEKNILPFIEKWGPIPADGFPKAGIHYDFEEKRVRFSLSHPFLKMNEATGFADLLEAYYTAYLVSKSPNSSSTPMTWNGEIFCWWLIAKQIFLEKLNPDKKLTKAEMEESILKYLRTRNEETKWLQPTYHALASNGYTLAKNILSNESDKAFTRIWEEIQKQYSTVVTAQFMEKTVLKYWEGLEKQSGLKMAENTLKWSKVLRAEWNINETRFLKEDPQEKLDAMMKKYYLLKIIHPRVDYWNLLGLPHDFQDITLEDPEAFFKTNTEPFLEQKGDLQ